MGFLTKNSLLTIRELMGIRANGDPRPAVLLEKVNMGFFQFQIHFLHVLFLHELFCLKTFFVLVLRVKS